MTLKVRRRLLATLLVPALMGAALNIVVWIFWFSRDWVAFGPVAKTSSWWLTWRSYTESDSFWALAGLSFLCFFPLVTEHFLRRNFNRSPSPEMFFFRFFLLTLPLQSGRLVLLFVTSGTFSPLLGLIVVKMTWFARFLGTISLLNIGLYSLEIPFRRSSSILGMGALASLVAAIMMPLDTTQILGNLLLRDGVSSSLALVCLSLEALAILSVIGTSMAQRSPRILLSFMALPTVIIGWDMIFFTSLPLLIPGALFMLGGTVVFTQEIRKIYLWI